MQNTHNGLVTDTKDFADKYNTKLTPEQESAFQLWATSMSNKIGRNILNDLYDYDMRGAFLDGLTPDGNLHWNDKFKKPNHMTFSDESIYHNVDGYKGGHWSKDKYGHIFTPSENMIHSDEDRETYWLKSDEYRKGNHLHNAKGDRLISGSAIIPYEEPSLKAKALTYWRLTPPQDKFMDALTAGLSLVAGAGPALRGLVTARAATKPVANAAKDFVTRLGKGLAKEYAENKIADKLDSELVNHAFTAEDAYRVLKLLRKW